MQRVVMVLIAMTALARAEDEIHSIRFADQRVVAGATFGLLASDDAAASWHWMCPAAVGYSGLFEPDYELTSGAVLATTFDGLRVMRDGCSFGATPLGMTFVSSIAVGPDGAIYAAASDAADTKIYKSTDQAMTFPTSAAPAGATWWTSIEVAPSDASRVYLAGYEVMTGGSKQHYLYASSNGGTSFGPLSIAGLVTTANSTLELAGVDASDPNIVYVQVTFDTAAGGASLYRSADGGASWSKILSRDSHIAFLASRAGILIAGTRTAALAESSNGGASWTTVACSPHVACLAENAAGEIWACTHNFDADGIPSDGFAIMKRGSFWAGVMRVQDVAGPVDCATGTVQHDTCAPAWPAIDQRLDTAPFGTLDCPMTPDDFGPRDDTKPLPAPQGCCSTSGGGASALLALFVLVTMVRSREYCPSCRAVHSSRRRRCGSTR